jgi:hypothetical protein
MEDYLEDNIDEFMPLSKRNTFSDSLEDDNE